MYDENKSMVVVVLFLKGDDSPIYDHVVDQIKRRPEWQKGLRNFPGGIIEDNETPEQAASRELEEETGIKVSSWNMIRVGRQRAGFAYLYVVYATSDLSLVEARTIISKCKHDELVAISKISEIISKPNNLPDLPLMINECLKRLNQWEEYRSEI